MNGHVLCRIIESARREGYKLAEQDLRRKLDVTPMIMPAVPSKFMKLSQDQRVGVSNEEIRKIIARQLEDAQ